MIGVFDLLAIPGALWSIDQYLSNAWLVYCGAFQVVGNQRT
jgi:hypothetical protein